MNQLIVFDFDWSLADQDSDRWVVEVLAIDLRRKMEELEDNVQWTDLVAQTMKELQSRGVTREEIENALRIMPFHPAMVRAVKSLHQKVNPKTTFLCLSNANAVYISTILEAQDLTGSFIDVITNPAGWSEDGQLWIRRKVEPAAPQHACKVGCSPNMCKGEELTEFLKRHGETFDRIIYVGDGNNDFCPILHLRSQDLVLARKGRALETRIKRDGEKDGLVCGVKYWSGAWEIEEYFATL